jgi:hypothetical protein
MWNAFRNKVGRPRPRDHHIDRQVATPGSKWRLNAAPVALERAHQVVIWLDSGDDWRLQCEGVCQFSLCSPELHCSGPIQPRPMERHPGVPFMISVRGVRSSGASFGISSHADKKSRAAIEAFAITIRVGRDRLDSPNAAALVARIEAHRPKPVPCETHRCADQKHDQQDNCESDIHASITRGILESSCAGHYRPWCAV